MQARLYHFYKIRSSS